MGGLPGVGENQTEQVIVGLVQGRCRFSDPLHRRGVSGACMAARRKGGAIAVR